MGSQKLSVEQAFSEQKSRWFAGEPVPIEELIETVDASESKAELLLDLIYSEVLLREQLGESPDPVEYQSRFPEFESQISKQFQIHRAIEESSFVNESGLTPEDSMAFPTPDIPGFEILELLGRGASGVAWKARDLAMGRDVAIKIVGNLTISNGSARAQFEREAEAVATLNHPAIVPIYQVGTNNDGQFLVMGIIEGCSLASKLHASPIAPKEAAAMMLKVANAIKYAHEKGIIHRDLKPANILIDNDGQPFVCDFGLARKIGSENTIQSSGQVVGTPAYMPFEQAMGGKSNELSDLYSLGVVFYEMLSGHSPFRSATSLESLHRVINGEAVSLRQLDSSLPKDLETICQKCMEKSPGERYRSVAELESELKRFLEGQPISARPISAATRLVRWCRREPRLASLMGVAALLAIGLTAVITFAAITIRDANVRSVEAEQSAISAKVDTLVRAAPDAAPFAIESLDSSDSKTVELLRIKAADDSLDARARLHAALGLARCSEYRPQLVADCISDLPLQAGSCTNIVRYFGDKKSELSQACVDRAKSGDVDSRFRFAVVALFLGDPAPSEKLADAGLDPTSRAVLIHRLQNWHGGFDLLARILAEPLDANLKSALCISTSRIDPRTIDAIDRKAIADVLAQLYLTSPAGSVHSASRSAMLSWKIPLPTNDEFEPTPSATWHNTDSGLTMIRIPSGSFVMGSDDERLSMPRHEATIENEFWMSDREISSALFKRFVESSSEVSDQSWKPDSDISPSSDCPAQNVTWTQAIRFCNWLSEQEGLPLAYTAIKGSGAKDELVTGWKCDFSSSGYRLPSDAEWGYAARCGSAKVLRFSFGDDPSIIPLHVRVSNARKIASLPCGSLIPNQFGLFDLEGNVWEWVWDQYIPGTEKDLPGPLGPDNGLATDLSLQRVIRGGGVDNGKGDASAESRGNSTTDSTWWNLGLRVVRSCKTNDAETTEK